MADDRSLVVCRRVCKDCGWATELEICQHFVGGKNTHERGICPKGCGPYTTQASVISQELGELFRKATSQLDATI